MIRVVVVDDHEVVRKGLISYLQTDSDIHVVGEAESGNDAVKIVEKVRPDTVLMDLIMRDGNGIEATRKIVSKCPHIKVIILTSYYSNKLL